jgi:ubiquinone/menaquinone biosynthesis C-methylase UbiE
MRVRISRQFIPEGIPWFAADLYDRVAKTAVEGYYRKVAEEVVAAVDCGVILDVGIGPGYLPIEIARMAPNIRIDGIDLSKRLIEIARGNAAVASVAERLHFEVGNANKLRFDSGSYDMVISTGVFHSWRKPVRVLNECHRVLKAGKEAWIYDPAEIVTNEGVKVLRSLGVRDRFAYRLASFISKSRAYSKGEIYEIMGKTKFEDYQVEERGNELKIRLRKGYANG